MAKDVTTVRISTELRDKLKKLGVKGETYEDIIQRLVESSGEKHKEREVDQSNRSQKTSDIGYKKTCDCPDNHISCITAKDWVKGMVTIQTFYYEGRDVRNKHYIQPSFQSLSQPISSSSSLTKGS